MSTTPSPAGTSFPTAVTNPICETPSPISLISSPKTKSKRLSSTSISSTSPPSFSSGHPPFPTTTMNFSIHPTCPSPSTVCEKGFVPSESIAPVSDTMLKEIAAGLRAGFSGGGSRNFARTFVATPRRSSS